MKAVGVKQLKAHLSDYLRLAKAGETVLVTEREEVVAELRPARRQPLRASNLDEMLDELADSGEIQRPSRSKRGWRWRPVGLGLSPRAVALIMDAMRQDR
jgi:antitoxin (DNA-binding transcriptional repressor) of toxin-antitoxin stability system